MENNYYQKYLKYKSKYLELKKQLGGNGHPCYNNPTEGCIECCNSNAGNNGVANMTELTQNCYNKCKSKCLIIPDVKECNKCCNKNMGPNNEETCKVMCGSSYARTTLEKCNNVINSDKDFC
jgi:hypothetical protein